MAVRAGLPRPAAGDPARRPAGAPSPTATGTCWCEAGLGASFGRISTLATGGTEQYGLPHWSPGGQQLYLYGAKLYTITGPAGPGPRTGRGLAARAASRADPDPPQYVSVLGGRRLARIDAAGRIRIGADRTGHGGALVSAPAAVRPNPGLYQNQAAVSPDGTRAAVIDQVSRQVYVINLRTAASWRLPGIRAYQLGYAGPRLVIQRENGNIDLRGPDGTTLIRSIQAGTPWNYGNFAVTSPAAGGPGLVAEERANGQGVLADLGTGHVLGVFPVGKASPFQQTTMAFTPGNRSLVTVTEGNNSSPEGRLTQLSLVPAQWVRVACTTSGHGLTAQDWRRYISSTPPAQLGCGR